MAELCVQLADAWRTTGWIEIGAVALALAYLVLAIRENINCWVAGFISSALYVVVLFEARLYMESLLNVYYAAVAAYGYWHWRGGAKAARLHVGHWPLSWHLAGLAAIVAASLLSSIALRAHTAAAWPFADSLVTWASAFATLLVARKVYENWHWWLVIDTAAMYLYFTRHLYATMALFAVYIVLIAFGMREWRRSLAAHAA
jgi:nicotinamide mononucleotide transporter